MRLVSNEDRAPRVARVELVQDLSRISSAVDGFLKRYQHRAQSVLTDGQRTGTYVVDYVDRDPQRRHAACVLPYVPADPSEPPDKAQVILRRQMRYPVHLVLNQPLMLEAVAGIIEGSEAPVQTAVRELWEEAGLRVAASTVRTLGAPFFPSPGILTECIHVLAVPVSASALQPGALPPAPTDGSEMEQGAELLAMELQDALALAQVPPGPDGLFIADAKTEIALHRLKAQLTEEGR